MIVMNKQLYEYLEEHNYISEVRSPLRQKELSKERAECICNKASNLCNDIYYELIVERDLTKEEKKILKKVLDKKDKTIKEAIDYINNATDWQWDNTAYEDLLQILERTENK